VDADRQVVSGSPASSSDLTAAATQVVDEIDRLVDAERRPRWSWRIGG
jgi:hypothetical protein